MYAESNLKDVNEARYKKLIQMTGNTKNNKIRTTSLSPPLPPNKMACPNALSTSPVSCSHPGNAETHQLERRKERSLFTSGKTPAALICAANFYHRSTKYFHHTSIEEKVNTA